MNYKKQVALLAAVCISSACFAAAAPAQTSPAPTGTTQTTPAKKPAATTAKRRSMSSDPALLHPPTLNAKAPDTYEVKFTTTKGDFTVKVTRAWSPNGADRFYNLAKHHFYDGAVLFRVVTGFVVQFGISSSPAISKVWRSANIKDDSVTQSNKRGFITFATAGPNTRTTQVFINLGDNGASLDRQGFSPFGEVTEGMDVIGKLYSGYADQPTNQQDQIETQGKAFLDKSYPKLDSITTTVLVGGAATPAAHTPTHHTTKSTTPATTTPKP
jgi:peptidyl-prolyl cis-trans isomerase A (cyclophilin A)